jgi:hypothetical protein
MAQTAKKIRTTEVAGIGCWIQFIGLLALVLGYSLAGESGAKYGGALLLIFLVVGSIKSVRWICGSCKNPLHSKAVTCCPACKCELQ